MAREFHKIDHCDLCEHQTHNSNGGYVCSVTKALPSFDDKCSLLKFGTRLESELKLSYLHHKYISKHKIWNIIQSSLASGLGLATMAYGFYTLLWLTEMGVIAVHPFPVIGAGILALGYGIGSYLNFFYKNKDARERYEKACNIAGLYNVRFKVSKRPDIKAYHGIEENDAVIEYYN